MGCSNSKSEDVHPVPQVGNRRRLSNLQLDNKDMQALSAKHDSNNDTSKPSPAPQVSCMLNKVDVLLDLLPPGDRRLALIGQQTQNTQKSFEEKCQALVSTELGQKAELVVENFGIGYACKKGLKPDAPNQDDFVVLQVDHKLGIYGVFDGHGPYGHEISSFTHQLLPGVMLKSDSFATKPLDCLKRSFEKTQNQILKAQEKKIFDANLSGTTGTVLYLEEDKQQLHAAHVGDSRAVIAKMVGKKLKAEDICIDHKPGDALEKARIQKNGGQVRCLAGDVNDRVFVKGRLYPGLAMSRSIGDLVARQAGVVAEPDVKTLPIDASHQFMLVCSDGVWEFISSQEAVDIVSKFDASQSHKAAEALAQEAWTRWVAEEECTVDDITVIVINLKSKREASAKFCTAQKRRDDSLVSKKNAADQKKDVMNGAGVVRLPHETSRSKVMDN